MLRANGIEVPDAELPACPDRFAHVMEWFEELSAQRRLMAPIVTMQAILPAPLHPLVWTDMQAWATQTRAAPRQGEWRMLERLDLMYRNAAARAAKPPSR